MKRKLPLLPNGEIDFARVDMHNDFDLLPPLFKSADDISNFIVTHNVKAPVLKRFLFLAKENKLSLTPAETKFYFDKFFEYIYDVYRVPISETYKAMKEWIDYLEARLINNGLQGMVEDAFKDATEHYNVLFRIYSVNMEEIKTFDLNKKLPIINCHELNINDAFYTSPNAIESFWIKTDLYTIQPECVGDEAYARVHVFKNKVYIYGCDDCSWTLSTFDKNVLTSFVHKLKRCCPVWNFKYPKYIHTDLKFTN